MARARVTLQVRMVWRVPGMWKRRAEDVLKQILDSRPTNVPALMMLGSLYAEGQLAQRAGGLYKKVLELDPENREARQALDALESPGGKPRATFGGLFSSR